MIPPEFDYLRPHWVDEAVTELGRAGEDAKVLAGGQSLLPLLRLRLAYPTALVDLGGVAELRGVRLDGDQLVIGAMTTHYDVLRDPLVLQHAPVLAQATATVADPAVRHRGTLGGALAHADPAGDLPAVALALDAEFVIEGPAGRRTVPAAEFFSDYLETAIAPGELLVEIRVPALGPEWTTAYEKFNRVAQAWAIVGVAALVRKEGDRVAEARIGLTNMGPTPLRATAAEQAIASGSSVADAAQLAAEDTEPSGDLSAQPDYRQHLARVLTRRALEKAAG
ncbi:MAG TPA: xanthine dehydrogenase family protein subunit M [Mycobacteriales bacterium]|nr:xanthine dehydrogenase family protein subunit M [Mycobacteriales bacterium]